MALVLCLAKASLDQKQFLSNDVHVGLDYDFFAFMDFILS
jgi:hypothetical protein